MNTLAIAAAILRLAGHPAATGAPAVRARILAAVIVEEAARANVNPYLVVAIIQKESGFNPQARGDHGDLGLMQIRRVTAVPPKFAHLTDAALMQPRWNIRLGLMHLGVMIAACNGNMTGGLAKYNGGRCRSSPYAREVLRLCYTAATFTEIATK